MDSQGGPQGTLLGDMWRATPRGWKAAGGVALLGLAAWGAYLLLDGIQRRRLRASIEATLAALPPVPPDPVVPDGDNAAVVYRQAFDAVVLKALVPSFYGAAAGKWTTPPPEVAAGLKANAEALRLLEAALSMPAFSPGPANPFGRMSRPGSVWDLANLASTRALVEQRAGRVAEAVASALLVPRMARQVGAGHDWPFSFTGEIWFHGILQILEEAVADPRLDAASAEAILGHLPTGEEARAASVEAFEGSYVRNAGRSLADCLAPDGEAKARARGWRPPTFVQRMKAKMGMVRLPPGTEAFPGPGQIRLAWEATLAHRERVGLRGRVAAVAVPTTPYARNPQDDGFDRAGPLLQSLRTEFAIEARLEVVRAAAALRLLEMRGGRAPGSLAELVPGVLPAPTRDPFGDGELQFELHPDGWTVSSAGPPGEWPTWLAWKDLKPAIRWRRPGVVPQDGGR